jgi:hypothetical protein
LRFSLLAFGFTLSEGFLTFPRCFPPVSFASSFPAGLFVQPLIVGFGIVAFLVSQYRYSLATALESVIKHGLPLGLSLLDFLSPFPALPF